MIVLSSNKILKPLDVRFWKSPSIAQLKDEFGNENRTVFCLTARVNDGGIVWKGVFEDRDDFDAFLWAIANNTIQYEKEVWRLPVPNWSPDIGEHVRYDFATVTFLVSPTGSNQTYTVPTDWNKDSNKVETIGGGASGGINNNGGQATGGGGGAYNSVTNLTISGSVTYQIGGGGASPSATLGNIADGNDGGDSWFNATTLASSSVGSKAGIKGVAGTGSAINGGSGGASGSGVGSGSSGGRGGNISGTINAYVATGGGGAAGPSGAGGNGGDLTSAAAVTSSAGGSANNGATAGGSSGGGAGGNGTEFDATHGSGSGGGGNIGNGGAGGQYGGGGGSGALGSSGTFTGGAGNQGIVVVTYTPIPARFGNSPMLGM